MSTGSPGLLLRVRHTWQHLLRLQHTLVFKGVLSAAVVVTAIGWLAWIGLAAARSAQDHTAQTTTAPGQIAPNQTSDHSNDDAGRALAASEATDGSTPEAAIERMLAGRADRTPITLAIVVGSALLLVVIWLGLAVSYLVLVAVGLGVALPLASAESTRGFGWMLLGILGLTGAFAALMQAARAMLSGPGPVFAVARNTLQEAVKLRLSLVFIVLLVFGLPALPGLLDDQGELRYRVQAFLQYGTGGSFWLIALLVLLFSVATVAFEQRDRLIWQTMTKPVAAWQYVLGKWLGVTVLSGVLLAVCASGIFMFTEFLRQQTAIGEVEPYVAATGPISHDRLLLESQVLAARVTSEPDAPFAMDHPDFLVAVGAYIDNERVREPDFATTDAKVLEVTEGLYKTALQAERSVAPGGTRAFVFTGLSGARHSDRPVTVRFKIDVGENDPRAFYELIFSIQGDETMYRFDRELPPQTTRTITVPNNVVDRDGTMTVLITNAGLKANPQASETVRFAPGGLEVSYSVGGYRLNFLRVMVVLWIKLAALAMLGVCCATALSFPVATLVSATIFLAAEGAGFLTTALESYRIEDREGNTLIVNWAVAQISHFMANLFSFYASLSPTTRLVNGRLLGWSSMMLGMVVLLGATAVMFAIAVLIFRRRELATYSGN